MRAAVIPKGTNVLALLLTSALAIAGCETGSNSAGQTGNTPPGASPGTSTPGGTPTGGTGGKCPACTFPASATAYCVDRSILANVPAFADALNDPTAGPIIEQASKTCDASKACVPSINPLDQKPTGVDALCSEAEGTPGTATPGQGAGGTDLAALAATLPNCGLPPQNAQNQLPQQAGQPRGKCVPLAFLQNQPDAAGRLNNFAQINCPQTTDRCVPIRLIPGANGQVLYEGQKAKLTDLVKFQDILGGLAGGGGGGGLLGGLGGGGGGGGGGLLGGGLAGVLGGIMSGNSPLNLDLTCSCLDINNGENNGLLQNIANADRLVQGDCSSPNDVCALCRNPLEEGAPTNAPGCNYNGNETTVGFYDAEPYWDAVAGTPSVEGGCSLGGGAPSGLWLMLGALFFVRRRRV